MGPVDCCICGRDVIVEPVGQGGHAGDPRAPPDVAAPLVGHAVEEEGQDVAQKTAPRPLPQPEERGGGSLYGRAGGLHRGRTALQGDCPDGLGLLTGASGRKICILSQN